MANKIVQNNTRHSYKASLSSEPTKLDNKRVIQKLKRELPKIPSFSSPYLISQISNFTSSAVSNYYLGFGGLGDAILLLSSCWDDPKAKVIFFANSKPFIQEFFSAFNINVFIHDNVMGTQIANHVYDYVTKLNKFKQSAHLADGLDYNDWKNEEKYIKRIKPYANWVRKFGMINFDNPTVVIAPSGSHKTLDRQRYLNVNEYNNLVNTYLKKNYKVYVTGSINDLHFYGLINHKDFYWLNSTSLYEGNGKSSVINLKTMLQIINGANLVLSMDTWLKSYALICRLPTIIIKTRWNNSYKNYGDDITDHIFLNRNIWSEIKILGLEELNII